MPTRLQPVDVEKATGATKAVLDTVNQKMGKVPNIFKLMANSPAAVDAFLAMSGALSKGTLSAELREKIAITCAEVHVCEYCLSAHYAIAKSIGMSEADLDEARNERSKDAKESAILAMTRAIILHRGEVNDNAFAEYRAAGITDAEISEVIALIGLNTFTNYFNKVAQTEVDFPRIKTAFPV
jgi:uncharacterized peroxidase-related enzyme